MIGCAVRRRSRLTGQDGANGATARKEACKYRPVAAYLAWRGTLADPAANRAEPGLTVSYLLPPAFTLKLSHERYTDVDRSGSNGFGINKEGTRRAVLLTGVAKAFAFGFQPAV